MRHCDKLTPSLKRIIKQMQGDENLRVREIDVQYRFLGKSIPFDRAIFLCLKSGLLYKISRDSHISYYALTEEGKNVN